MRFRPSQADIVSVKLRIDRRDPQTHCVPLDTCLLMGDPWLQWQKKTVGRHQANPLGKNSKRKTATLLLLPRAI